MVLVCAASLRRFVVLAGDRSTAVQHASGALLTGGPREIHCRNTAVEGPVDWFCNWEPIEHPPNGASHGAGAG